MTLTTTLKATTALLLLSAGAAYADGHATHPETGEPLASEQNFVYRVGDESPSYDPGLTEDVDGSAVVRDLFEGLMNQAPDGSLIPGVATGYEVSDDGMTYTFTLRDNAKWSNGDPVTAGDFVYAWRRAASPELASPYSWYMELMSIENGAAVIAGDMELDALGVSAPDDTTLVVQLSTPLPYFPQMIVHATTFPVHQATVEAHGADWVKPENIVFDREGRLASRQVGRGTSRVRLPDRPGHRQTLPPQQQRGHLRHARLHGSRGHVPLQPPLRGRLLRLGRGHLRVDDGSSSLCGQIAAGDQVAGEGEASADS